MPRTSTGFRFVPAASMPSIETNGATSTTPGTAASRRWTAGQSAKPCGATMLACALMLRRRVRVSVSSPFMTDRIVISAATPSAMPISDAALMNDTTPRRRRERR